MAKRPPPKPGKDHPWRNMIRRSVQIDRDKGLSKWRGKKLKRRGNEDGKA